MSAAIQNSASLESKCTEIYDIRFEVLFWMTCPLSTVKFRFSVVVDVDGPGKWDTDMQQNPRKSLRPT